MLATTQGPRRLGAAFLAAVMAVMVAACGGSTATSSAPAAASAAAPSQPAPAGSAATGESPAASPAGYTGPPVTIRYSIWGDPQEIASQTAIAEAFHAANPNITVDVDVSDWDAYWDKLQTGLAANAAPDVFAMDGPLFPDYQSRDVLLDLKPMIDRDGYDLTQLADQGVADFTTADGGQFGLPRDLNTIVLYYNKAMFDAAGIPYPDDTWDWTKFHEVATKLTDSGKGIWGGGLQTSWQENYYNFILQNGGTLLNEDMTKCTVDSPEASEAFV